MPVHRPITGFARDEHGDWAARLSCGHRQHVRHDPPFFSRPWVTSEEGRRSRMGAELDCVRCDRLELPPDLQPVSQTPVFTESSIPPGLLRAHTTAPGVWGRILLTEGRLGYEVPALGVSVELTPEMPGVIVPEAGHHVVVRGPVRFHVALFAVPGGTGSA
jgi:tellurite resistance-related uncharacterized protein